MASPTEGSLVLQGTGRGVWGVVHNGKEGSLSFACPDRLPSHRYLSFSNSGKEFCQSSCKRHDYKAGAQRHRFRAESGRNEFSGFS